MKNLVCFTLVVVAALHAAPARDLTAQDVAAQMASAATAFTASLNDTQKQKTCYSFDADERLNWHFIPKSRNGIALGELSPDQQKLAKALAATALSEDGVRKISAIRQLEAFLRRIENDPVKRNPDAYFTTIFGNPSATGTWGWRFEGHHLSLNLTIVDGKTIIAAPAFMGANPAEVREGEDKGMRVLATEEDQGRLLAQSLVTAKLPVVYAEKPPTEIETVADRQARSLPAVGVSASAMSAEQRAALRTLFVTYAQRRHPVVAQADIAAFDAAPAEQIRFAWAGAVAAQQPYYYRLQTPAVLIECNNTQNNGNHVHSVWRALNNDFGTAALSGATAH